MSVNVTRLVELDDVVKNNTELKLGGFYSPPHCQPRNNAKELLLTSFHYNFSLLIVMSATGCYCYSIPRQRGPLEHFPALHDPHSTPAASSIQGLRH